MIIRKNFNFEKKNFDNNADFVVNKIVKIYKIDNETYKIDQKDVIIF